MNRTPYLAYKMTAITLALALAGCNSSDSTDAVSEAPEVESTWVEVWSDEFDGDAIDDTKWSFEVNCWGGGNQEQQCYTEQTKNAFIEEGMLNIVAVREDFTGPDNVDGDESSTTTLPYTSARLRTMNKGDWTYGRFEIRAKLPSGQGTWPAIWMLPTDYVYGGWAASGEIDIMEAVNLKTQSDEDDAVDGDLESRIHGTLHYGKAWPNNVYSGAEYKLPDDVNPADGFHTYAVEWEEGEIRWYVDNIHFATQQEDGWYSQYEVDGTLITAEAGAPFNQNFHLLLNLAVGGAWAGAVNETGIDESVFPQTLTVDYVRVYECSVSPLTGEGCATVSNDAEIVEGNTAPEIIEADESFGAGPTFTLYTDELATDLTFGSYNPDSVVSYQEVDETDRGSVLQVTKTGATGSVYFTAPSSTDLTHWAENAQLVFDLNVESLVDGTELLIKIDSGWPNVSDYSVTLPVTGAWEEIRIDIETLIANGNSFSAGSSVDMASVTNVFVIEPSGVMSLKLDNIRYEYKQVDLPVNFTEFGYTVTDFGGNTTTFVEDPLSTRGIVASSSKASNAQTWAGTTIGDTEGFATAIPFTTSDTTMSVWVYSPDIATPVLFKVEDSSNDQNKAEVEVLTTVANTWELMTFDFDGQLDLSFTYDKASIFFGFGNTGEEKVYYWDEISLVE